MAVKKITEVPIDSSMPPIEDINVFVEVNGELVRVSAEYLLSLVGGA